MDSLLSALTMIGQLLLGLSILIVLHEAGHYFAARAFGIRVEKFYLFFDAWGKKLFSFKRGGTEFGIGWLPLGGYVKIAGMVDESLDEGQLASPPKSDEFRSKPAWQRLIVMLGGVTVNFILGIIIFAALLATYGEKYTPNRNLTNGIAPAEVGREIGLQPGDKLLAINGKPIERYDEVFSQEVLFGDNTVLSIERAGQRVDLPIPEGFAAKVADMDAVDFVTPRFTFTVNAVSPGMGAAQAGLKKGDSLLTVEGKPVAFFDELQAAVKARSGNPVALTFVRGAQTLSGTGTVSNEGMIGIEPDLNQPAQETKNYGLIQAIPAGANRAVTSIANYAGGLGKIFSGAVPVQKSLGGPIVIAQKLYGGRWDWERFWHITGLLSLILAFMNLLPIPALDGGHVLFTLAEMLRGKPLGEKFLLRAQTVGMVLLLGLMVFIFGNDIINLIRR